MADKVEKPKKSKPKPRKDEKGVLAALPSTRPERIGTRRASAPTASAAKTSAARPSAAKTSTAKSATAKTSMAKTAPAKTSTAKTSTAKTSAAKTATARKPAAARATAARRKAAAPRTFEPTQAAENAAGAADERAAGAVPRAATPPAPEPRPRAVREGAPGIGTTSAERPDPASTARTGEQPSSEHGRPSGVELVTTAVQAAGELTQLGLTIGGQILKRAVDRLPKP